jgi:DNA-binding beta-propeller fold protein YncE
MGAAAVAAFNPIESVAQNSPQAVYYPVNGQAIPNTGQRITPLAPNGATFQLLNPGLADNPDYVAGQAVSTAISPDKTTMLVLTSGYNLVNYSDGANKGKKNPADSNEYVFIYDISGKQPVKRQVLQVSNTYNGIAFNPKFDEFYVGGGDDDNIHVFAKGSDGTWAEAQGSPISLEHGRGVGANVKPEVAGLAVSDNGLKMVVANYYNDSISILDRSSGAWLKGGELDLRPGKIDSSQSGVAGGEYPFWVVVKGNSTAYVSSLRDREIDEVEIAGSPAVSARIKVKGQPNKMTLNSEGSRLFVACDETDSVDVIDTSSREVVESIAVSAPDNVLPDGFKGLKGSNTNGVTLSADEKTLYVSNGNLNNVAVVALRPNKSRVLGLIPTGWYPNSVSVSADGSYLYIVNGKSPTGPNPGSCKGLTTESTAQCNASNGYNLQLIKAGLQVLPTPKTKQLDKLTDTVARNNHFQAALSPAEQDKLSFLQQHIKHVIFIVKENRTYDQVFGDLPIGNGDPSLTEFGQPITPNLHNLALNFVTLDNYFDRSEVSMDGWPWTVSAAAPDVVEKQTSVNYAGRGMTNDSEGTNRGVNVGYATLGERLAANPLTPNDPDVLPGQTDTAAPDGPEGQAGAGYLWDQALRANLTIRNYGFFVDGARYHPSAANASVAIPEELDPYSKGIQVGYSTSPTLRPYTDPYFRGFDQSFPDYYLYKEWAREFDTRFANGGLPRLSFVRLAHDHTGNYSTALLGVNTPELQVADNDYAVGLLVQKIAQSRYKDDTLVFVTEDDSQDGADHVDSHRSIAFIVGPYVKQGALVSTQYNTVNMVRTIEAVLGLDPLNLNDALAKPMLDVFTTNKKTWQFYAQPSSYLYGTQLLPPEVTLNRKALHPTHNAAYWANVTKGLNFTSEDLLDGEAYNKILWEGLMGGKSFPTGPTGLDLRQNREALLAPHNDSELNSKVETSGQ